MAMRTTIRTVSVFSLAVMTVALSTGCHRETKAEKVQRALTDTALPDDQAVALLAEGIFDLESASTETGTNGGLATVCTVRGEDMSGMPASVIDTAQGGIHNAMKEIQLMTLVRKLATFIERGQKRKLGDLVLTLKTPEVAGSKVIDWVETYRLRLPATKFQAFLTASKLDLKNTSAVMEKIWSVEFDGFGQFVYSKGKKP